MDRWAIYLDIEGTSKLYVKDEMVFFRAFDALLATLHKVGTRVYPETPNRLFVHQLGGDGLIIVSEFAEGIPEVPISIATILLQVLLMNDTVGKAGISAGTFADIRGCYPALTDMTKSSDNTYCLGRGVLTTFPVMGTALINAHRFASNAPNGSLMAVDRVLIEAVPLGVVLARQQANFMILDWVHTRTAAMESILFRSELDLPPSQELEKRLTDYVHNTGDFADTEWGCNTLCFNGCLCDAGDSIMFHKMNFESQT